MSTHARFSLSPGDVVAGVPLLAYGWLGLTVKFFPHAPASGYATGVALGAVFLAVCTVPFGAMLVTLDDLASRRRSPELARWLARVSVQAIGCLLFAADLAGVWRWISD